MSQTATYWSDGAQSKPRIATSRRGITLHRYEDNAADRLRETDATRRAPYLSRGFPEKTAGPTCHEGDSRSSSTVMHPVREIRPYQALSVGEAGSSMSVCAT